MTNTENWTDFCVHPAAEAGMASLLNYMPGSWQRRFIGLGLGDAPSFRGATRAELRERLDAGPLSRALLVPLELVNAWPDPDLTAVVLRAANDYFLEEWLPSDDRLGLSIVISGQDPAWSAGEVRRHAHNDRVIAAGIAPMHVLLGHRSYRPIYEACVEHRMPLIVFPTGAEGLYLGAPETAGGATLTTLERRVSLSQIAQAHVNSLIFDGVFERFPELRVVFAGYGFSWLAPLVWRMDMDWRRTRVETPWVKRPPSEYVRDHVRFTTSDDDAPGDSEDLRRALRIGMADAVLVYGSGFPLSASDSPGLIERFDDALSTRVTQEAPAELWNHRTGAVSLV